MSDTANCQHQRTQLIAKDNEAEYVECLDCGAILEAGEIPASAKPDAAASTTDSGDTSESLSDA